MSKTGFKTFDEILARELEADKELKVLYDKALLKLDEELDKLQIAKKIESARKRAGISQAKLAKALGTKQQSVSRWEKGDFHNFRLKTLMRIALATGSVLRLDLADSDAESTTEKKLKKRTKTRQVVSAASRK
jgi:DNA-binding XRE family transcriptional regulator